MRTNHPRRSHRNSEIGDGAAHASSSAPAPATPDLPDTAWIAVGEIVGAFGIRGEVKVLPQTDFPDRFARTPTLYLGDARAPRGVQSARQHQRIVVLKLDGVDDATAAQRLRGLTLWIPEAERMPLTEDQFYLHDVVGLKVVHVNGQPLGEVVDFITGSGNDLFVVRATPGGRDVLLPAVREFIRELDIPGGVLRVDPIPGLFDDQGENAADSSNPDELVPADISPATDTENSRDS
ncbi:MAG TPA: ribosome maturation factor RimM [Ktedonobacterales bacterium]|nr:ribosome maturation factor RimM [Ktedonobacterales bacterium]